MYNFQGNPPGLFCGKRLEGDSEGERRERPLGPSSAMGKVNELHSGDKENFDNGVSDSFHTAGSGAVIKPERGVQTSSICLYTSPQPVDIV